MLLVDSIPVLRAKGFVSLKHLCVPSLGQIWQKQCGGFAAFAFFFFTALCFFPEPVGLRVRSQSRFTFTWAVTVNTGASPEVWSAEEAKVIDS